MNKTPLRKGVNDYKNLQNQTVTHVTHILQRQATGKRRISGFPFKEVKLLEPPVKRIKSINRVFQFGRVKTLGKCWCRQKYFASVWSRLNLNF